MAAGSDAVAWDASTHGSIVRAAFRLSPAAEARVPAEQRDAFFEAVAGAELKEATCLLHVGERAKFDVARRAAALLADLRSAPAGEHAYARARALGSYLHYVADCAVPPSRAVGNTSDDADFFVNKDFVVFRKAQGLADPLEAALRNRGADARWGEDEAGADSAVFRLVVNLTVEALLLLPGPAVPDPALVMFLVNRMDNGFANGRVASRFWFRDVPAIGDQQPGQEGAGRPDMLGRKTVLVVEWQKRPHGSTATARALLFNTTNSCIRLISLATSHWTVPVASAEMPPGALLPIELEAPAEIRLADVAVVWKRANCASPPPPGLIGTQRRLVLEAVRRPKFESAITEWSVPPTPAAAPGRTPPAVRR